MRKGRICRLQAREENDRNDGQDVLAVLGQNRSKYLQMRKARTLKHFGQAPT